MIRGYAERNYIGLISFFVLMVAVVVIGALTAHMPLVAIALLSVGIATWFLAQRPDRQAWILAAGVMFPIVALKLFEVNLKIIDLALLLLGGLAIFDWLATGQKNRKKSSQDDFFTRIIVWGYVLFFVGALISWYVADEKYHPTIYLVEAFEAYVVTLIIVSLSFREPSFQRYLLMALVVMGVLAGVHGVLAVRIPQLMPTDYYTIEAGAYEGVLRVRGFHSFTFGFVEAVAAVVSFAFFLETLERLSDKRGMRSFINAMTHLSMFVLLTYAVIASLVRVWLLAESAAIFVTLMLRRNVISTVLRKPVILLGFVVIATVVGFLSLSSSGLPGADISYIRALQSRFSDSEFNLVLRFDKWRLAWDLFGRDVLWGVGGGNAKLSESLSVWYASYGDIDNGYLQVLVEVGIIGLVGVALMLIGSLAKISVYLATRKPSNQQDVTTNTAILGGIIVVMVSLFMWNLWSQGSSGAILSGLLIALAFSFNPCQEKLAT